MPQDLAQPRGKQDWLEQPHKIWYDRTTGIWQPIWLEAVAPTHISQVRWTPDLDRGVLNLYDQDGSLGPADVVLVGSATGAVRGSVVVDPGLRKITFIKTGGPLAADDYTLTAVGSGLRNSDGTSYDGDGDGLPDAWELRYFGSLNGNASDDADDDGLTNLQEFQLGTVPTVNITRSRATIRASS